VSLAERLAKTERPDRLDEVRTRVQGRLIEVVGPKLYDASMSETELQNMVQRRLRELLDEDEAPLSNQEKAIIIQQIGDSVLGLGPLEPYVRDPEVTEVMVNNANTIYVERGGKIYWTGAKFYNEEQLRRTIDKIVARVGRRIDESVPFVDARLPDGSRVNAIIPPLAIDGPALTIRRFSNDALKAEDLVALDTLTNPSVELLHACVRGRLNVLVSGGTGAGKTTTRNYVCSFNPDDNRTITIEHPAERRLQQPHVVRLQSRPSNIGVKFEATR